MKRHLLIALLATVAPCAAHALSFTPGDIVVSVEGAGDTNPTTSYTDNQAAPLSLFEYSITGTSSASQVGSMVLPQTASGANSAFSGEYGSSSEGSLQLTGDGQALTIMGYGVNAAAFNANPGSYSPDPTNTALGQSGSVQGQGYTAVPRVVAVIGADGSVDTTTAVYGVYNTNNPRSVYSPNGTSFYISGQGNSPDNTGGVFFTTLGSNSASAVTGLDTNSTTSAQDTRFVTGYNGQVYVSVDSKEGSGSNRDFVGTLGAIDTSATAPGTFDNSSGPIQLTGFGGTSAGKTTLTATNGNPFSDGLQINLSPEDFFFANSTTLYVADSGSPKNTSASSAIGDGGLQKWTFDGSAWVLDYTITAGLLDFVENSTANPSNTSGTTGLYGLTGKVLDDGTVELFATNFTIGDTDQTYLYGISDNLGYTTAAQASGESFTELAAAPTDSTFKGVSFAPTAAVPEPASWAMMLLGVFGLGGLLRSRRKAGGLFAA